MLAPVRSAASDTTHVSQTKTDNDLRSQLPASPRPNPVGRTPPPGKPDNGTEDDFKKVLPNVGCHGTIVGPSGPGGPQAICTV
jgi:hypothetical protein